MERYFKSKLFKRMFIFSALMAELTFALLFFLIRMQSQRLIVFHEEELATAYRSQVETLLSIWLDERIDNIDLLRRILESDGQRTVGDYLPRLQALILANNEFDNVLIASPRGDILVGTVLAYRPLSISPIAVTSSRRWRGRWGSAAF